MRAGVRVRVRCGWGGGILPDGPVQPKGHGVLGSASARHVEMHECLERRSFSGLEPNLQYKCQRPPATPARGCPLRGLLTFFVAFALWMGGWRSCELHRGYRRVCHAHFRILKGLWKRKRKATQRELTLKVLSS